MEIRNTLGETFEAIIRIVKTCYQQVIVTKDQCKNFVRCKLLKKSYLISKDFFILVFSCSTSYNHNIRDQPK